MPDNRLPQILLDRPHPQTLPIISTTMPSPTSTTLIPQPEPNKLPGIHYAVTPDGVELPVVDITHPAFALSITEAEQKARVEKFLHEGVPFARLPKPLRELALKFLLRDSLLAQGIQQARVTFMSGLQTYLLKLGPQMLGSAYAKPIDRQMPQPCHPSAFAFACRTWPNSWPTLCSPCSAAIRTGLCACGTSPAVQQWTP